MIQANLIPLARQDIRVRRIRLRRWLTFCTFYCVLLVAAYGLAQGLLSTTDLVLDRDVVQVSEDISFAQEEIAKVQPRLADAKLTLAASRAVGDQPDWSALVALLASELRGSEAIRFSEMSVARAQLEALAWGVQPNLTSVLDTVIDRQLHNIVLSTCELEPIPEVATAPSNGAPASTLSGDDPAARRRYQLAVHGLGRTPGTVSQFVLRLEKTNLFERVTLIESKRIATGDQEVVSFRIQCVLGK
mgnify:FL=1